MVRRWDQGCLWLLWRGCCVSANPFLSQVRPITPEPGETLFCETLVAGDTLAAYTAVLAILRQGGTVCWVIPSDRLPQWPQAIDPLAAPNPTFRSLLGAQRYHLPPQGYLSQSQWDFWRRGRSQPVVSLPADSEALAANYAVAQATLPALQRAIAPDLNPQGLTVITGAQPTQVLLSRRNGTQRVYQVAFRRQRQRLSFRIHAPLTLDATAGAVLSQRLATALAREPQGTSQGTSTGELAMVLPLTAAHGQPRAPRSARGQCFADAIGVLPAVTPSPKDVDHSTDRPGWLRPLTLPLRALIPQGVGGWLRVTQPSNPDPWGQLAQSAACQWTLGEGAGSVARVHQRTGQSCLTLATQPQWQQALQRQLAAAGIPLFPFDDVAPDDPDFVAIHTLAAAGIVCTMCDRDLHFRPQTPITYGVVTTALGRLLGWSPTVLENSSAALAIPRSHWAWRALVTAIASGQLPLPPDQWPYPNRVLSRRTLAAWVRQQLPPAGQLAAIVEDEAPARRRDLSRLLYGLWQAQATGAKVP